MSIRVMIADDHRIIREGIRMLLDSEPDMTVIAEAENGRRAVELAEELGPDVIVMDISMPDLNGIEAARKILANRPDTRIIALSMHSDRQFIAGMIGAGAAGYLLKDCAFEELARAIRAVAVHQTYLSPSIAGIVVEEFIQNLTVFPSGVHSLTEREREVLQLIAEGNTIIRISSKMHLSGKTVESHKKKIMNKLDIHSIAELTRYAVREGLTSL